MGKEGLKKEKRPESAAGSKRTQIAVLDLKGVEETGS